MVKTNAPDKVTIAGKTFQTNALPDQFDELDLLYRPRLQLLPGSMDRRVRSDGGTPAGTAAAPSDAWSSGRGDNFARVPHPVSAL